MTSAVVCTHESGGVGNRKHNTVILNAIFKICMQIKCVKNNKLKYYKRVSRLRELKNVNMDTNFSGATSSFLHII